MKRCVSRNFSQTYPMLNLVSLEPVKARGLTPDRVKMGLGTFAYAKIQSLEDIRYCRPESQTRRTAMLAQANTSQQSLVRLLQG
jgi:hypothetical protein